MRRSILLLPVVAVAALTGCVIGPPALTVEDPAPSPDVSTQPGPDDSTQPSAPPTPSQEATAEEPEVTDELGPITPGGEEGSVGNPFPAGADLTGGEWSVALFAADLDAEGDVVAGGGLPAPEGWTWISSVVQVSTTASDATTADVWASYVTPGGQVYFSVIDSTIPGTNPFEDMVSGQQYEFTEYLLAPSETLAQGVLAITTDGRTSFIALR